LQCSTVRIRNATRKFRKLPVALLLVAAAQITAVTRGDSTITVTSLTDALSLNGQTTLRGAIQTADAASGTDTIQFAPSLFTSGSATLSMAGTEFPITNSVIIQGPAQNSLTINAQQLSRIFDISNSSAHVSISGMTLTNGLANANSGPGGSGGAIYNTGSLTVQNVTLSSNKSASNYLNTDTVTYGGGGIYNLHGNVSIQNSSFTNNPTTAYGGGLLTSGGTVSISGGTFSGNTDRDIGGSIAANDGASLTITNTTADNPINTRYFNTSPRASTLIMTTSKVGQLSAYGTTTITNCTTGALNAYETVTVSNSTVGVVGTSSYVKNGILSVNNSTLAQLNQQYGNATVTNSTFKPAAAGTFALSVGAGLGTTFLENDTISGYQSTGNGTVYFPVGGNATVRNSTIAGNQAGRGGGIFVASGNLSMDSTIVADNTATVISNDFSGYATGQNNLVGDPTGAFLLSSNNLTGVDPEVGPLADNGGPTFTMALLSGSPALDAGSNIDNLPYDQRGYSRDSGAGPDIGAYELQVPEPSAVSLLIVALPFVIRRRHRIASAI
jgi:hypothetical protein